jgi:hypothetical protein
LFVFSINRYWCTDHTIITINSTYDIAVHYGRASGCFCNVVCRV